MCDAEIRAVLEKDDCFKMKIKSNKQRVRGGKISFFLPDVRNIFFLVGCGFDFFMSNDTVARGLSKRV